MGAHSDQALDLEEETYIAVYSCYKCPNLDSIRTLIIESKVKTADTWEIPLMHNTVIVFSTKTNQYFKHKIILDKSKNPPDNTWLGITYRTSKTFINYERGKAYFESGEQLTLANTNQLKEFYKLRGAENKLVDFRYPKIGFSISESDLVPPLMT